MTTLDTSSTTPNTAPPIWETVLRYGGICGLALTVYSLLAYLMDVNMTSISAGIINFVVTLAISVGIATMAIRQQRGLDGGYITYGRGLLVGMCVTAIGIILYSIWNYVLITVIDPEYVAHLKEQFVEQWGENMPEEAMEETMANFDKMGEIGTALKNALIGAVFFGLITGLIAAAFGKKSVPIE